MKYFDVKNILVFKTDIFQRVGGAGQQTAIRLEMFSGVSAVFCNEVRTNALSLTTTKWSGFVNHCILNLYESQKMTLPHYSKSMSIWPKIFGGLVLDPNWAQSTKLGQNRAGSGPATVQFDLELPSGLYFSYR